MEKITEEQIKKIFRSCKKTLKLIPSQEYKDNNNKNLQLLPEGDYNWVYGIPANGILITSANSDFYQKKYILEKLDEMEEEYLQYAGEQIEDYFFGFKI
jgi:hypothetical protein